MSLLPQRKKSAEEIAELRGNLGIPSQSPADDTAAFADAAPLPKIDADAFDLKKVKSPVDDFSFVPTLAIDPSIDNEPYVEAVPKSENEPVVAKLVVSEPKPEPSVVPISVSADADEKIPSRRHSPGEIDRLRLQRALAQVEQVYDPRLQKAHPFLVALGYIPVIIGTLIVLFYEQPIIVTAPFVGFSMLVALYVLLRKPISRHHAGFIFAICFLAIAFGILHYFPQLQHAA
ncbi:MAG: hypothetical protein NTU84_09625 [Verrucomicrobia bacterium]|nr:hypothetical protein [Verrucomicrobiota bacterium]